MMPPTPAVLSMTTAVAMKRRIRKIPKSGTILSRTILGICRASPPILSFVLHVPSSMLGGLVWLSTSCKKHIADRDWLVWLKTIGLGKSSAYRYLELHYGYTLDEIRARPDAGLCKLLDELRTPDGEQDDDGDLSGASDDLNDDGDNDLDVAGDNDDGGGGGGENNGAPKPQKRKSPTASAAGGNGDGGDGQLGGRTTASD